MSANEAGIRGGSEWPKPNQVVAPQIIRILEARAARYAVSAEMRTRSWLASTEAVGCQMLPVFCLPNGLIESVGKMVLDAIGRLQVRVACRRGW